jgi:hypothetical protein
MIEYNEDMEAFNSLSTTSTLSAMSAQEDLISSDEEDMLEFLYPSLIQPTSSAISTQEDLISFTVDETASSDSLSRTSTTLSEEPRSWESTVVDARLFTPTQSTTSRVNASPQPSVHRVSQPFGHSSNRSSDNSNPLTSFMDRQGGRHTSSHLNVDDKVLNEVLCRKERTYRWIDVSALVGGQAVMYPKRGIKGWETGEVPWEMTVSRKEEQEREQEVEEVEEDLIE